MEILSIDDDMINQVSRNFKNREFCALMISGLELELCQFTVYRDTYSSKQVLSRNVFERIPDILETTPEPHTARALNRQRHT